MNLRSSIDGGRRLRTHVASAIFVASIVVAIVTTVGFATLLAIRVLGISPAGAFKTDDLTVANTITHQSATSYELPIYNTAKQIVSSPIVVVVPGANPTATAGIQEAINSLGGNPGTIVLAPGTFAVTTTINITHNRQNVVGFGKWATTINYTPVAAIPLFSFSNGGLVLFQNQIGGFAANDPGAVSVGPVIKVQDASEFWIHDISSLAWLGTGLELHGRELHVIERLSIQAQHPIQIQANPNTTIELDAYDFRDLYLLPTTAAAGCFEVSGYAAGTIIQHWRMDGIDCVGGQYGVFINDTVGNNSWLGFDWRNMHWEQQTGAGGYFLYLNRTAAGLFNNATFTNIDAGSGTSTSNGFFFRNTFGLTAINLSYQWTAQTALDADASNQNMTLINPFWQTGSTATNNSIGKSLTVGGNRQTLDLQTNLINHVADPVSAQDAETKAHVASLITTFVSGRGAGFANFLTKWTDANTIAIGSLNDTGPGGYVGDPFAVGGGFLVEVNTGNMGLGGAVPSAAQSLVVAKGTNTAAANFTGTTSLSTFMSGANEDTQIFGGKAASLINIGTSVNTGGIIIGWASNPVSVASTLAVSSTITAASNILDGRGVTPTPNHGSINGGSTNLAGGVNTIGANTSVTLTFANGGFPTAAFCTYTMNNHTVAPEFIEITNSKTAPVFNCFNTTTGIGANCDDFTYHCIGN